MDYGNYQCGKDLNCGGLLYCFAAYGLQTITYYFFYNQRATDRIMIGINRFEGTTPMVSMYTRVRANMVETRTV
jgi:hypothetical protein